MGHFGPFFVPVSSLHYYRFTADITFFWRPQTFFLATRQMIMPDNFQQALSLHTRAFYRIQLQGQLDPSWADALGGMQIEHQAHQHGDPSRPSAGRRVPERLTTVLSGELPDQAALAGVLSLVYTLGLPLISVEWLEQDEEERS